MKRARLVLILAALAACAAGRTQPFPEPPVAGPPRDAVLARFEEVRLPNGLRVVVAQRAGIALVTAHLLVLAGSEFDPPDRAGLAALTANLLTKGTRTRAAPALALAAETLGGSLNASAGCHASAVSMTVSSSRIEPALALITEVFTQPVFAAAELERARRLTLAGLRVAYAEPGSVAQIAATRALFGAGAYGHPDDGTPASLARITRADLRRLHALLYRPDEAVLVLAGDITPETGLALARRYLGDWRAPAAPLPRWPLLQGAPLAAPVIAVDLPGASQASVVVTLPGIARDAPDYVAGQVANALLGGDYSSRLNQEIRIRRGLSYGASSSLAARRGGGQIVLSAQTENAAATQVLELMRAELARVAEAAPADDELQARKATLIGKLSRSVETTEGLAQRLAQLAIGGVPLAQIDGMVAAVAQVTPDQVQQFARAHWRSPALRVAVAGDAKEFGATLRQAEPALVTIPIRAFDPGQARLLK